MDWPNDADGDALSRLETRGFDFTTPTWVDFNIDFDNWPPPDQAVETIKAHFPDAVVEIEEDGEEGYFLVRLFEKLNYEFVIRTQGALSEVTAPLGGHCESWGVLH